MGRRVDGLSRSFLVSTPGSIPSFPTAWLALLTSLRTDVDIPYRSSTPIRDIARICLSLGLSRWNSNFIPNRASAVYSAIEPPFRMGSPPLLRTTFDIPRLFVIKRLLRGNSNFREEVLCLAWLLWVCEQHSPRFWPHRHPRDVGCLARGNSCGGRRDDVSYQSRHADRRAEHHHQPGGV